MFNLAYYVLHNCCWVRVALQTRVLTDVKVLCLVPPQVTGGSGRLYTCLVSCHYCPCPAFSYSVLRRNDALLVSLQNYAVFNLCLITDLLPRWHVQTWRKALCNQAWDKSNTEIPQVGISSGLRGILAANDGFSLWTFVSEHLWSSSEEDPCSLEDAAKIGLRNIPHVNTQAMKTWTIQSQLLLISCCTRGSAMIPKWNVCVFVLDVKVTPHWRGEKHNRLETLWPLLW